MHCMLSINATFLEVIRKWFRVASYFVISTIILTTSGIMNHFDLLTLLELNFFFESFESLQQVKLFTNELEKTTPGMIINERDEIFMTTHSRRGE